MSIFARVSSLHNLCLFLPQSNPNYSRGRLLLFECSVICLGIFLSLRCQASYEWGGEEVERLVRYIEVQNGYTRFGVFVLSEEGEDSNSLYRHHPIETPRVLARVCKPRSAARAHNLLKN